MRNIGLLLLLASLALPALAARQVTVAQLEHVVDSSAGKPDIDVLKELAEIQLSERLSAVHLSALTAKSPGPKTSASLLALANAATFLNLPPAEIPATPPPSVAAQRQMLGLAILYVARTIPQLPNFLATRVTVRYDESPQELTPGTWPLKLGLHAVDTQSAPIAYVDGRETDDPNVKISKPKTMQGMISWGEFGPILGTALVDASRSKLAWSHWEQAPSGPIAVFQYSVTNENSHYSVNYCCIARYMSSDDDRAASAPGSTSGPKTSVGVVGAVTRYDLYTKAAGYHGTISLDPPTGTILRITVVADLNPSDPISHAATMVEYGTVQIGDRDYTCPLRSVTISEAKSSLSTFTQGQTRRLLNDVTFRDYHRFRATVKIVSAEQPSTTSENAMAKAGLPDVAAPSPAPDSNENATELSATAPAVTPTLPATAPLTIEAAVDPGAESNSIDAPEFTLQALSGLAIATPKQNGFVLKTTARLVDIGFVAYDRHGKPVTDLKPQDVQVFDNGMQQQIRLFVQASPGTVSSSAQSTLAEAPTNSFSNQLPAMSDAASSVAPSATVFLLDASHLPWQDFVFARNETIKFLGRLAPSQPVALYAMDEIGFHVLVEMTRDHAMLAAKLKTWMPSAGAVSGAQQTQERNSRHLDVVQNSSDLSTVNGAREAAPDSGGIATVPLSGASMPLDPQLRDNGANPGRESLRVLIAVARHLAPVPGHKSLIWISGDAALVDWSDNVVNTGAEKLKNKYLNEIADSAGEALNQAHVALYALDASVVEAGGVDASLYSQAIGVKPTTAAAFGVTPTSGHIGAVAGNARPSESMQADLHTIQEPMRRVAQSTGGRAIERSSDLAGTLDGILRDTEATYMASFTPDSAPDGSFHKIVLKVPGKQGITLRYRSGYMYAKESDDAKARFQQAVWRPVDTTEIGLSAKVVSQSPAGKIQLTIALKDLALDQNDGRFSGKVDVFLVQRDEYSGQANSSGQTIALNLTPATHQQLMTTGFSYRRTLTLTPKTDSVRLIVVDQNSGRMGSITLPAKTLKPN